MKLAWFKLLLGERKLGPAEIAGQAAVRNQIQCCSSS